MMVKLRWLKQWVPIHMAIHMQNCFSQKSVKAWNIFVQTEHCNPPLLSYRFECTAYLGISQLNVQSARLRSVYTCYPSETSFVLHSPSDFCQNSINGNWNRALLKSNAIVQNLALFAIPAGEFSLCNPKSTETALGVITLENFLFHAQLQDE